MKILCEGLFMHYSFKIVSINQLFFRSTHKYENFKKQQGMKISHMIFWPDELNKGQKIRCVEILKILIQNYFKKSLAKKALLSTCKKEYIYITLFQLINVAYYFIYSRKSFEIWSIVIIQMPLWSCFSYQKHF